MGQDDGAFLGESTSSRNPLDRPSTKGGSLASTAVRFAKQAEKLSPEKPRDGRPSNVAVEARFVTPQDPIIVTENGGRLPGVPLEEAHELNFLREELQQDGPVVVQGPPGHKTIRTPVLGGHPDAVSPTVISISPGEKAKTKAKAKMAQTTAEGSLRRAMPPSHTNPLFPPLPLYGPQTLLRNMECMVFRFTSFFLSLAFLAVIVLGALFTSLPGFCVKVFYRLTLRNPNKKRPFYAEEVRRQKTRKEMERSWKLRRSNGGTQAGDDEDRGGNSNHFTPTEGGPDPIRCDVGYYARRVGLDVEEFQVQTEDGFLLDLWHVYDPKEYTPMSAADRAERGPEVFGGERKRHHRDDGAQKPKFPVLLMHGLLQSAGAYCVNDDDSLAFYLCKSGFDVWLGNNRCGFRPKHVLLEYRDPRMWCWNIRQMGVFDLPALTSRVLYETGFAKIGLICHSQGTTQTFVALAKEQRPDLGEKLTVFCALAPAAYAGPLIGKMYFKFMRVITPALFRLMFGIHAFIPFMMKMHALLPPRLYGWLGYQVFSFLFDWSDARWDRGLRDRMFQFAPVYVSAESMRWWLGRECFAKHKCILSTQEEWRAEEREDNEAHADTDHPHPSSSPDGEPQAVQRPPAGRRPKGSTAWYNAQVPPFALWVGGRDDLVDGRRLLRRFARGREPHVRVVHAEVVAEYEHLDVLWAVDAVDRVFGGLREVLWKTCDARDRCRVPRGCEAVAAAAAAGGGASLGAPPPGAGEGDDSGQSSSSTESLVQ